VNNKIYKLVYNNGVVVVGNNSTKNKKQKEANPNSLIILDNKLIGQNLKPVHLTCKLRLKKRFIGNSHKKDYHNKSTKNVCLYHFSQCHVSRYQFLCTELTGILARLHTFYRKNDKIAYVQTALLGPALNAWHFQVSKLSHYSISS
jgi:hypothetical protein